jgi:hypothetical protein
MSRNPHEIVLRFEPEALERCYAAADILDEDFGRPTMEYALLGLASATDPLRVVATPLLPRQRVTSASVDQPGHGVFAMRREIEALSESQGRRLIPISFIHRHPGSCAASAIDLDFLTGPFLRQLSTLVRFDGLAPEDLCCASCSAPAPGPAAADEDPGSAARPGSRSGLAFSLIVNRRREHWLYAATRTDCSVCTGPVIRLLPARLASDGEALFSRKERALRQASLREEIAAKIELPSETLWAGVVQ